GTVNVAKNRGRGEPGERQIDRNLVLRGVQQNGAESGAAARHWGRLLGTRQRSGEHQGAGRLRGRGSEENQREDTRGQSTPSSAVAGLLSRHGISFQPTCETAPLRE